MTTNGRISRRQFVSVAGVAGIGSIAGCSGGPTDDSPSERDNSTETGAPTATESNGTDAETEVSDELIAAIEEKAVAIDLAEPGDGLDAVAETVTAAPIVGIGENSHGVREFKAIHSELVRRLVADHSVRLVAMEGTLGDFSAVTDYVRDEHEDLDAAMDSLHFYFWRTPVIRELFEWLREFNVDRPGDDQAVVYGYDAQYYDVNAGAIWTYLDAVDPDYLAEVDDRLEPLASPHASGGGPPSSDEVGQFTDDLRERLESNREAYVSASSEREWRLAKRHVRNLERGVRVVELLHDGKTTGGEALRDESMAANVTWLRDWTGTDRAVVLGSSNHTARGYRADGQQNARMGQHLADQYGDEYYSLGQLFGSGTVAAPADQSRTEFETSALGGPLSGTPAAVLAQSESDEFFLDFNSVQDRETVGSWLAATETVQFSVPRTSQRGAIALPGSPGTLYDGVVFVRDVSAAQFSATE